MLTNRTLVHCPKNSQHYTYSSYIMVHTQQQYWRYTYISMWSLCIMSSRSVYSVVHIIISHYWLYINTILIWSYAVQYILIHLHWSSLVIDIVTLSSGQLHNYNVSSFFSFAVYPSTLPSWRLSMWSTIATELFQNLC